LDELFVIVGLGNPGERFENTRHNVGFDTVDLLAYRLGIRISRLKFKALLGEGFIGNKKVMLVKPQTFMNCSGESVRDIVEWYKIPVNNIILIYDDVDLEPGRIRVRGKGSAGTHNGMKSVIYQIQSDQFPRVRIGIGKSPDNWDLADYVLSKFTTEERKIIDDSISMAAEAAITIVNDGVEAAMNKFNGKAVSKDGEAKENP